MARNTYYTRPGADVYTLYNNLLSCPHLLVAGATGTGKSTLIRQLITTMLAYTPDEKQYILIDPKQVELYPYANLPHSLYYADTPERIKHALESAVEIMSTRYTDMKTHGARTCTRSHVYIIIDELADMMTTAPKTYGPLIQRLAQLGRAANIHVIACTQCPLATVIPTPIKVNFDDRICLRTRNAQDSRNIMDQAGGETLPKYGYCYWRGPLGTQKYALPLYDEQTENRLTTYWKQNPNPKPKQHPRTA